MLVFIRFEIVPKSHAMTIISHKIDSFASDSTSPKTLRW